MNKIQKKEFKRINRRMYFLNNICGIISILLIILTCMTILLYDTINAKFNIPTWTLEKKVSKEYFQSEYKNINNLLDKATEINQEIEAEGCVLLFNNNNALPLSQEEKISCFSVSSVYVNNTGQRTDLSDGFIDLKSALEAEGFKVNEKLWNYYNNSKKQRNDKMTVGLFTTLKDQKIEIEEKGWNELDKDVLSSIKTYSDVAIITITRLGNKKDDLDYSNSNSLELNKYEKEIFSEILKLKNDGVIKKIIVLLYSSNPIQMDYLEDNEYKIDACMWIGEVGNSGLSSVSKILSGKINPSGKLVDTFVYDNYSSPAMQNISAIKYKGYNTKEISDNAQKYLIYQEGIYIGYKYYETRYEDYVKDQGNTQDYQYNKIVAFPFGYGLSYTEFRYDDLDAIYNEETDQFELHVTVTNIGEKYAGKETLQVYAQTPYTEYDKEKGIEKSAVNLVGYIKTNLLEPGETEDITINIDQKYIASYDSNEAKTYIMDEGDYFLTIAQNAHDATNNFLAAYGYDIENTNGRMDKEGRADLVCTWRRTRINTEDYSKSNSNYAITNQLENSDVRIQIDSNINYLSRKDWKNTWPQTTNSLKLDKKLIENLQTINKDEGNTSKIKNSRTTSQTSLLEFMGLDYDDERWNQLINGISINDMNSLVINSNDTMKPNESINLPGITFKCIKNNNDSNEEDLVTYLGLPSQDLLAATFNDELAAKVGDVIAEACLLNNVNAIYGPNANIKRTPFGGNNDELYSEDSYLSGKMCSNEVNSINAKGIIVLLKDFAIGSNSNNIGTGIWINEQAAREIYLKSYEIPIESNNNIGVVVSNMRLGSKWIATSKELITNILINEWNCKGIILSYSNEIDKEYKEEALLAGISSYGVEEEPFSTFITSNEKITVNKDVLKNASHRNLYNIVNSSAMNNMGKNTTVRNIVPSYVYVISIMTLIQVSLWIIIIIIIQYRKRKFLDLNE